jgi:hypothetical protein
MNMGGVFEGLKTSAKVITEAVRGRDIAEALVPLKRNRLDVVVIERCKAICDGGDGIMRRCCRPTMDKGFYTIFGLCDIHGIDLRRVTQLAPSFNTRTSAGANWQAGIMGSAEANPASFIALTATAITPANADTTLSGEITSSVDTGLARAASTYQNYTAPASTGAAASYQQFKLFTSGTGSRTYPETVASAGMFNASSTGVLFVEAAFSASASLGATGDQISVTWTVNI